MEQRQEQKLLLQFAEEGKAIEDVRNELKEIISNFEKDLNAILEKLDIEKLEE